MDTRAILEQLGLTGHEAKVYLALLELGPCFAGTLSRKTGIHRRNIYDITDRLSKKGIVGYIIKNNRRLFSAVEPERFLSLLKEREETFKEALPQLQFLFSKAKDKPQTLFYTGKEGLKSVFEDQLQDNDKKKILLIGASNAAFDILPFYFKWYDEERISKKIKVRILANEKLRKRIGMSEIKLLPEKYTSPLAINIYKDKVALILWQKSPLAIIIEEKAIADSYRKYFELMWHNVRRHH